MLLCMDVDYRDATVGPAAVAAGVVFSNWTDDQPVDEVALPIDTVDDYTPGQFYRRELPCLMKVIEHASLSFELTALIVDGFVWLGDESHPGLGAKLYDAVDQRWPVIGVAKTFFVGASPVAELNRPSSRRPLYISSAGLPLNEAVKNIGLMTGEFRVPTLLKRVDQVCRQALVDV